MKTSKPLWMNQPEPDQTSIRFTCPFCYDWIRREEFEVHIKENHPQVNLPEQKENQFWIQHSNPANVPKLP